MLYTLNSYNVICQLYLNGTGEKRVGFLFSEHYFLTELSPRHDEKPWRVLSQHVPRLDLPVDQC